MISALLLLVAASAPPVPPAPPATVADDRMTAALALAKLTNSEAVMVGEDFDTKALEFADQLMKSSEDIRELENDYPGIAMDMAKAAMPIINQDLRNRLTSLWDRQSKLYSDTFNLNEIQILIDFYGSPTGQKLLRSMQKNLQPDAMLAEAKGSTNFSFGAESVLKDIQATVPAVLEDMNEEDETVLILLAKSSALPKLQAIAPATHKIAIDWMNEPSDADAKMEAAMSAAVEARLAQSM